MSIFHKIPETKYTLDAVIKYIADGSKHSGKVYQYEGINVNSFSAARDMLLTKKIFYQEGGSQYKHFIVSFEEHETPKFLNLVPYQCNGLNPWKAFPEIAWTIANLTGCQLVYAVHGNTGHIHMHIVINSVCFETGSKLNIDYVLFVQILQKTNDILKRYGLSEIRTYKGFLEQDDENVDEPWWKK